MNTTDKAEPFPMSVWGGGNQKATNKQTKKNSTNFRETERRQKKIQQATKICE